MDYQTKHQELRQEIIGKLSAIADRPKGWLPHVVYVQDGDFAPMWDSVKGSLAEKKVDLFGSIHKDQIRRG